jgi:hypothetical protein
MAIDNTGISSLDSGALDIRYTGDEGPKSPNQIAGGEYNRVLELIEKVREGGPLSEEEKIELQRLIQTLTAKGIDVETLIGEELTGGSGDMRMASVDPTLQDEYDKYVFELQEMHPEAVPMSIEQFKQQAVAGMADGGIMRTGFFTGMRAQEQRAKGPAGGATRSDGGFSDKERFERQAAQRAAALQASRGPIGRSNIPQAPPSLGGLSSTAAQAAKFANIPLGGQMGAGSTRPTPVTTGGESPFAYTKPPVTPVPDRNEIRKMGMLKNIFSKRKKNRIHPRTGELIDDYNGGLKGIDTSNLYADINMPVSGLVNYEQFKENITDWPGMGLEKQFIAEGLDTPAKQKEFFDIFEPSLRKQSRGLTHGTPKITTDQMIDAGLIKAPPKKTILERIFGADGGIARLGYANGQLVKPGPGRPGYQGPLYAAPPSGPPRGPVGGGGYSDAERFERQQQQKTPKYEKPSHPHFDTKKEEPVYILKDGIKHYRTGVDERGKPSTGYYDELEESEKEAAEQDLNQDNVIDYKDRALARQKKLLMGKKIYAMKKKGVIPSGGILDFSMWKSLLDPDREWPDWAKSWKTDEGVPMTDAQILEEMNKIALTGPYLAQQSPYLGGSLWGTMKFKSGNELLDKIKSVESGEKSYHEVFGPTQGGPGEGGPEFNDPCKGPNPPAWCTARDEPEPEPEPDPDIPVVPDTGTQADNPFQLALSQDAFNRYYPGGMQASGTGWSYDPSTQLMRHQFAADGGRVPAAYGGIMGDDGRRAYGLGSLLGSIFKPFKGIARGIKKFSKSKMGKLAIMAALGFGVPGTPFKGMFGSGTGGLGDLFKNAWTSTKGIGLDQAGAGEVGKGWFNKLASKALLSDPTGGWSMGNVSPWKSIGLMSILPLLQGKQDDENEYWKWHQAEKDRWLGEIPDIPFKADGGRIRYSEGKNGKDDSMVGISMSIEERWERIKKLLKQMEDLKKGVGIDPKYDPPEDKAMGGRIGYYNGGYNDDDDEEDHRMAALSAMYGLRKKAQEGGLMDMGGMEKDYRNEGGFVPIGGQERADDVPARLSKNEFVFTADAVRAAGGGDIDAGAEVMENVMENLEQGGQVSEESQGLEGARNMFATAQRLEGVL